MQIDINQQRIAVGDTYRIFLDGNLAYVASQPLLRPRREVELVAVEGNTPRLRLQQQAAWFRLDYRIARPQQEPLLFRRESGWCPHYCCRNGADVYDVYGHRGTKYSVYCNGTQVAWWDQARVTWYAGDNFKLWADDGSDAELLVAFCLVLDDSSDADGALPTATVNLGYIGPQAKVFDEQWRPRAEGDVGGHRS